MKIANKIFFAIFIFSIISCEKFDNTKKEEKVLSEILAAILPFEQQRIEEGHFMPIKEKETLYSDSNIVYIMAGLSYKGSMAEIYLDKALPVLGDNYFELSINKKKYNTIVASLCETRNLGFRIPENIAEFDSEIKKGTVYAFVQTFDIYLNKRMDSFFYYSHGSYRFNNFQEPSYSVVSVFMKKKGKWIFEKELY